MKTQPTAEGATGAVNRPAPEKNRMWYKSGIIYELHVRAFYDSNGDGTGDFPGLTQKLDYLRDLGITAIWLLPFYPSPLKDDGYDIADYYGVHPMYGTLGDFKVFLREAHKRGLRVITELVMNHTSDQHPWFQRARRSKPGSKYRDFYVWNDNPDKYKSARIIFKDTEVSNWTWDAQAGAFYWHRFFSHQPDLNFDNPAVHDEMFRVLDFWFDLGVDGVRLDAVPYLYEREGTNCENLPETHAFLKKVRAHVDEKYGDRMLLAEANQWPDDAVAYFGSGKGDECHMAFHFPLMPRLFMSLRMEDRVPVVDIMQQMPAIPETAQWALFLRNHDELTLEMVTDEERDYMYRMYAQVHQARLNLGIRRRLAPLVGNDRKRIELLSALLFSLPGTPVIYYGDEIGMGENIYLGDRNGVRTPMQWSADKNAGFSRANPQSLYLPINLDPENHYEAVNVEVQERNPHSLVWWMKRLIALYKRNKAFGMGSIEFLHPENRKIFVCVRRYENEIILVVANLSRFVQPVELDLSAYQSLMPVELFGRAEFPPITDKPYFMTLGPHAFYWLALEAKAPARAETAGAPVGAEARPLLTVDSEWQEVFDARHHAALEQSLWNWLPSRRWFGGRNKKIKSVTIQELIPVPLPKEKIFLAFLQVDFQQADTETYVLPLACAFGEQSEAICRDWPPLVIARLTLGQTGQTGVLYDAIANKFFCRALLDLVSSRRGLDGNHGELTGAHTAILRRLRMEEGLNLDPSVNQTEQNNSSIVFGDKLILKLFRRLDSGVNPELEILRFLTGKKFPHVPSLAGAVEYRSGKNDPSTLALLTSFVPKTKDAWEYTIDTLSKFYERVQTLPADNCQPPSLPPLSVVKLAAMPVSAQAQSMLDTYVESARLLGERTAELHLTLSSDTDDIHFAPEPLTSHSQRGLFQAMRNLTRQNFQLLSRRLKSLPPDTQALAQQVLALEPEVIKRLRGIYERSIDVARIRHHGDFHLGQVLYTGKDFFIIDFEGDPSVAISERRFKRPALFDVAGMIRSFHYAAIASLMKQIERGTVTQESLPAMTTWARFWARWVGAIYFNAYRKAAGAAVFLPANEADLQAMMDIYVLRKTIFELGYELNNRPDWVKIPVQGIIELMSEGKNL
ncbi:MAG TPA: maltose alpha-D-glucosyltransferase [Candidatus Sulfotelmatobacter sp.]|jgi:maltose alpha-D-glucosyltransferase/alpha-amylase|nr:maltose alpha-D-glucosyltransferase [Candidatus Sulfotelmatobacter sp.]